MVTVFAVVVAAGGTLWWRSAAEGTALVQDPAEFEALSEFERDAIDELLAQSDLGREVLIALNPSSGQAESIVAAVRTWREDNASTLAARKATLDAKVCAVRKIEKAIRMGPADSSRNQQLSIARQELATAKAARATTLASLESSVENLLSESQRATWSAIQSGWGRKMPLRMLDLTDSQRLVVSKARRTWKRQRAAASTPQERASAHTTWESALNRILTTDQKTVKEAYYDNYATASSAVADAYETVLAVSDG